MLRNICFYLVLTVHNILAGDPPGHMKPLGHHRPPEGAIEELEGFPTPWDFYEKYVQKEGIYDQTVWTVSCLVINM